MSRTSPSSRTGTSALAPSADAGERVEGTDGPDVLFGPAFAPAGRPPSALAGNGGGDVIVGGFGIRFLDGGDGADVIVGWRGAETITGGNGGDIAFGNGGADLIDGGKGHDRLHGGGGDDQLHGGEGRDRLFGGRGSDTVDGGVGDDVLKGGRGADVFHFGDPFGRSFGADVVRDFRSGVDRLVFEGARADEITTTATDRGLLVTVDGAGASGSVLLVGVESLGEADLDVVPGAPQSLVVRTLADVQSAKPSPDSPTLSLRDALFLAGQGIGGDTDGDGLIEITFDQALFPTAQTIVLDAALGTLSAAGNV